MNGEAGKQVSKQVSKNALRDVSGGACAVIKDSGIAGDFPGYMTQLKTRIPYHGASRFVQECLSRLESQDPGTIGETEARLRKNIQNSAIRAALHEVLSWPISGKTAKFITSLLEGKSSAPPQVTGIAFDQLSAEDKVRRIASLQTSDLPTQRALLERLIREPGFPKDLRAVAFLTAISLELRWVWLFLSNT